MITRQLTLVGAMLLAGCNISKTCTLIGCDSVLTLAFTAPPTEAFQVELLSVELGARKFTCADAARCLTVPFNGYSPDRVLVTVTNSHGSKQYNITPSYSESYPNGRDCGAACRSGTITVAQP